MAKRELIEELSFEKPELNVTVRAKIFFNNGRNLPRPFEWEISHYYQPTKDAGVYITGNTAGPTLEHARSLLEMYVSGFKNIVVPNFFFR